MEGTLSLAKPDNLNLIVLLLIVESSFPVLNDNFDPLFFGYRKLSYVVMLLRLCASFATLRLKIRPFVPTFL